LIDWLIDWLVTGCVTAVLMAMASVAVAASIMQPAESHTARTLVCQLILQTVVYTQMLLTPPA